MEEQSGFDHLSGGDPTSGDHLGKRAYVYEANMDSQTSSPAAKKPFFIAPGDNPSEVDRIMNSMVELGHDVHLTPTVTQADIDTALPFPTINMEEKQTLMQPFSNSDRSQAAVSAPTETVDNQQIINIPPGGGAPLGNTCFKDKFRWSMLK